MLELSTLLAFVVWSVRRILTYVSRTITFNSRLDGHCNGQELPIIFKTPYVVWSLMESPNYVSNMNVL